MPDVNGKDVNKTIVSVRFSHTAMQCSQCSHYVRYCACSNVCLLQSIIFLQTLVKILAQEDRLAWPKHNASLPHWRQGVRWAGRDPARSSSELGHTHPLDALLKSQNAPSYLILAVAPADMAKVATQTKNTNSSVPKVRLLCLRLQPTVTSTPT